MTCDGLHQVRSSMAAKMAIVYGHEEESRTLLAAAQANLNSALQLQCAAAEDLELLHQKNLLLQHIIYMLFPDSQSHLLLLPLLLPKPLLYSTHLPAAFCTCYT